MPQTQNALFLLSSFCSLLIWLGRAFLEMDFIFLGLEVIFKLGPPRASTTCVEESRIVCIIQVFNDKQAISQPHGDCNPNSRGSSSSWFPQVASSIFSPGAHRRYRFLQIEFHSVCKTIYVEQGGIVQSGKECIPYTQRRRFLQTSRVQRCLLPKTASEVFLVPLTVREARA